MSMTTDDIRRLIGHLTSPMLMERAAARVTLLKMDEDVIQPLADELYSGVSEPTGVAILELMGEIGGWEALAVLQDIYFAESSRSALVRTAAAALRNNGLEDLLHS